VSNIIEISSGQSVSISGISTVVTSTKITQPSTNVSVTGVIASASASGDKSFTFTQSSASTTWNINHNLGKKPSVSIADSADSLIHGAVSYTDLNNLTISLSAPTSGTAYLN
jgi:hypothetical protein|tara:strand:- start:186 stop:521 length:336 start_codon:yes stop_codon:yes gene_type:complete